MKVKSLLSSVVCILALVFSMVTPDSVADVISDLLYKQIKTPDPYPWFPGRNVVWVKNSGGFLLRVRYFDYKDDRTCCKVVTDTLSTSTGHMYFPPGGSEVYLHAIAAGGWTKCASVDESVDIRCARASLNMHCYYTHGTHGHIRGIKHGGCAFPLLYFSNKDDFVLSGKMSLKPGTQGDIYLLNKGATDARNLKIFFRNAKDNSPGSVLKDYFFNNKTTCFFFNTLKPGHSCILHYIIPANPSTKGTGDFKIVSTADYLSQKSSLALNVKKPGNLAFQSGGDNLARLSTGSADTGTIQIRNTGEVIVNNFHLVFQDSHGQVDKRLASYFSGGCIQVRQLAPDSRCNLNYSIPVRPKETGSFKIIATGNHFSGKANLSLLIALRGHLIFMEDNRVVEEVPLIPGSRGSLVVRNIGALPITDFQMEFLNGNNESDNRFKGYFRSNCDDVSTLAAGGHCNLNYEIPKEATSGFLYFIKARGAGGKEDGARLLMPVRRLYLAFSHKNPSPVMSCRINEKGMSGHCVPAIDAKSAKMLDLMLDIKLQRHGKLLHAYLVTFKKQSNILVCTVDPSTGTMTGCHNSGASHFGATREVTFSPDGSRAYFGEYTPGVNHLPYVYVCDVQASSGMLKNCRDSGAKINKPYLDNILSVAMNPEGSKIYIVYTTSVAAGMVMCQVNPSSGGLADCLSASHFKDRFKRSAPTGITFIKEGNLAYIPHETNMSGYPKGGVDLCQTDTDGFITECENSGFKGMKYPFSILTVRSLRRVYVYGEDEMSIVTCISDDSGYLSECQSTAKGVRLIDALAVYPP